MHEQSRQYRCRIACAHMSAWSMHDWYEIFVGFAEIFHILVYHAIALTTSSATDTVIDGYDHDKNSASNEGNCVPLFQEPVLLPRSMSCVRTKRHRIHCLIRRSGGQVNLLYVTARSHRACIVKRRMSTLRPFACHRVSSCGPQSQTRTVGQMGRG